MHRLALLDAELAIQTNPRLAEAHFTLGQTLQTLGNPIDAVESLKTALRLDSDNADFRDALRDCKRLLAQEDLATAKPSRSTVATSDPLLSLFSVPQHSQYLSDDDEFIRQMTADVDLETDDFEVPSALTSSVDSKSMRLRSSSRQQHRVLAPGETTSLSMSTRTSVAEIDTTSYGVSINLIPPTTVGTRNGSAGLSPPDTPRTTDLPASVIPATAPTPNLSSGRVTYAYNSTLSSRTTPHPPPPSGYPYMLDDVDDEIAAWSNPFPSPAPPPSSVRSPRKRASTAGARVPVPPSAPRPNTSSGRRTVQTPEPHGRAPRARSAMAMANLATRSHSAVSTPRAQSSMGMTPRAQSSMGMTPRAQSSMGMTPRAQSSMGKTPRAQSSMGMTPRAGSTTSRTPRPPLSARSMPARASNPGAASAADFRQFLRDSIRPILEEVNAKFSSVDSRRRAEQAMKRKLVVDLGKFDWQDGR
eukprot:TRINITY_DN5939_c0_g1_i2.p1 TRINITY_DN5939_c0_g1~~TRINITY_DN5939_c0_g1_i2.p1  ORF type:complete len:473 (+),score=59.68 TRINITY_DN5939_c0_g1_i2:311-1729(+)